MLPRLRLGAFLVLAACSVPGAEAFVSYEEALNSARAASEEIVVVYNEYDRVLRRRQTSVSTFDPNLADAYVAGALTPYSAEIRDGFAAATVYTEVLARYVGGDTLALQAGDAETLRAAAASTATLVGQPQVAAQIGAVIQAATALGNASLAQSDRTEFVRAVREGSGTVDAFLVELRARTRDMYARALSATALARGNRDKLAEFQAMLGAWVLLIDQTRADLATLRRAVETPDLERPVLSGLAESAVRIDANARRIALAAEEIRGVF